MFGFSRKATPWLLAPAVVLVAALLYFGGNRADNNVPSVTPSTSVTVSAIPSATGTPRAAVSVTKTPQVTLQPTPVPTQAAATQSPTPTQTPTSSGTIYLSLPKNGSMSAVSRASSSTSTSATYQGTDVEGATIKSIDVKIDIDGAENITQTNPTLTVSTGNGKVWEGALADIVKHGYNLSHYSGTAHIEFAVPLQVSVDSEVVTLQATNLDMSSGSSGDGVIVRVTAVNLSNSGVTKVANLPLEMKMLIP